MAIRKDLDDMLNNLKGNSPEKNLPAKKNRQSTRVFTIICQSMIFSMR